jgi:putative ABC transport system substrate-binding protein
MRRRDFMIAVAGAAAAWPLAVRAQQSDRIRQFLESDPEVQTRVAAFAQGLAALGWSSRNLRIEHRFAGGDVSRIQAYVSDTVRAKPDLIVASSTPIVAALRQATQTIPIVFANVNDPVGQGFVANLARPGGNITGFSFIDFPVIGKWLDLLKEIAPATRRITFMFNPQTAPYYPVFLREFGASSTALAAELSATPVQDQSGIEAVVTAIAAQPGAALIASADPFINTERALIIKLAQRHRLPAIFGFRQFVSEGALISYGPDTTDITRRAASYVDRILKGEMPADLPVQAPAKYELLINLKTATTLGLTVPPTLLATADEVIE